MLTVITSVRFNFFPFSLFLLEIFWLILYIFALIWRTEALSFTKVFFFFWIVNEYSAVFPPRWACSGGMKVCDRAGIINPLDKGSLNHSCLFIYFLSPSLAAMIISSCLSGLHKVAWETSSHCSMLLARVWHFCHNIWGDCIFKRQKKTLFPVNGHPAPWVAGKKEVTVREQRKTKHYQCFFFPYVVMYESTQNDFNVWQNNQSKQLFRLLLFSLDS